MTKKLNALKMACIIALAVVCLGAVVGLAVKLSRKTTTPPITSSSGSTEVSEIKLNYSSFVFTDCVNEGGSASNAKSAVTLSATLPDDVTSREIEYSYEWLSTETSWGKMWAESSPATRYVHAVYDENDPLSVKLVCDQPFGEKILVTVKSVTDETLTNTCVLDYLAKITKVHMYINGDEYGVFKFNSNKDFLYKNTTTAMQYYDSVDFDFGVGTVTPAKGYLNLEVLPQVWVTDFSESRFVSSKYSESTLSFIDRYMRMNTERSVCTIADSSYKYLDFNSAYMLFHVVCNAPDLSTAKSNLSEIVSVLNAADTTLDFIGLRFSVYDSNRGPGCIYTVKQELTLMKNSSFSLTDPVA